MSLQASLKMPFCNKSAALETEQAPLLATEMSLAESLKYIKNQSCLEIGSQIFDQLGFGCAF